MKTKQHTEAIAPETIEVQQHKLTPDQIKLLPEFFVLRDRCNEAATAKKAVDKLLSLPRFEGKKVNVQLIGNRGQVLGIVEVRYRAGYPVSPGWTNTITEV